MSRFCVIISLLLLFLIANTFGQGLEIGGQVVARATNEPLVGANVSVKGTLMGTTSDISGKFRLSVKDVTEATVVVSYVGYKRAELKVTESTSDLKISLDEDILKTSEVVVTGFASSVKRENLANAVATISARELIPAPAQTLDQALAGKFAGITVSQNTGAPGGGISVNLRGVSTIEGRTQPLYVVDGVIINNSATQSGIDLVTKATGAGSATPQGQPTNRIADINPSDISSVEVLKGASAAALYGSKATNGVVILTTRRSAAGAPRVDFSHQIGFNSLLRKIGTRKFPDATSVSQKYGSAGVNIFNSNPNRFIDYEDEMYGENGLINETNISASGGTEQTQYYVSGLFRDENGIIKNTEYNKSAGRLNLFHKFSDRVRISALTSLTRSESDRAITGNDNTNTTLGFSVAFTPSFLDIRPANGTYPDHPFNPSNPLHTRDVLTNNEIVYRTIGSLGLNWNIVQTENQVLDFIAQTGFDFYSQENKVISPPELQYERVASQPGASLLGETESINSNVYLNLAHGYTTASDITFKSTGGLQLENQEMNNVLSEARGIIATQTNIDQATSINAYQTITKQREFGFYLQEEVNVEDKVFLTAGFRGDASSVNADPDKFYFFPKASGSVRLSQFDFWEDLSSTISEFKLRLAYGETGNLAPPDAKFNTFVLRNIGGFAGSLTGTRQGATDLRPERTKELETGFDATFLDENATLEFTYFQKNSSDLLLIHSLPPSSGFVDEWINGGELKTQGIEISLGVTPFREEDFSWTSRLNFYTTSSEITKLDVPAFNKGGFATFLGTYRIEEGLSPTTIVGSEKDANGKHIKLGDETPDFIMSFNNNFTYSNFELGFLWEWKAGGDIINLGKLITDLGGTTDDYDEMATFIVSGTPTLMKKGDGRLTVLGTQTAPYIEDGSYVKLRELKLTYSFPQETVNDLFGGQISYLRLGLAARNLLLITDYTGYDPEVSQFGSVAIGRSVDTLPFASSRSFYFNVAFGI